MTTLDRLENWKQTSIITGPQHAALSALVRKQRFSLFLELNALLYVGVLLIAGGLGWTFATHFEKLGDVFILGVLTVIFAGSFYYCWSKAPPYTNAESESPSFVLDYVLYLGCLVLSVELGYIEVRFQFLKDAWDNYLLFCSMIFFALAYRFDNRFVLSLALSSLAGWFGFKISRFGFESSDALRLSSLAYTLLIAAMGTCMHRQNIKKHFLQTYLHIAANVTFLALLSGVSSNSGLIYLALLIAAATASAVLGLRFGSFAFVVYGIVFGYIGISYELLRNIEGLSASLLYLITTGSAVVVLVAYLARRFGREE